jgi:putative transcriptional regulator
MVKTGDLLLAEPYLRDPNFKRSVIGIVDHHPDGSVGFVLNHRLDWRISELVSNFPDFDDFMYFGGPVQRDTLHFLHRASDIISDSIHVVDDIYWGGNFEEVTAAVSTGDLSPRNIKFFLGYSGWSPGQLQEEMEENTWVTSSLDAKLLFETPSEKLWQKAMRRLGNSFGVISTMDEESLN